MDPLLGVLFAIIIFAVVAVGMYYICRKFEMPLPVLWLCGAILLIIIVLWATGHIPTPGVPLAHK